MSGINNLHVLVCSRSWFALPRQQHRVICCHEVGCKYTDITYLRANCTHLRDYTPAHTRPSGIFPRESQRAVVRKFSRIFCCLVQGSAASPNYSSPWSYSNCLTSIPHNYWSSTTGTTACVAPSASLLRMPYPCATRTLRSKRATTGCCLGDK